MPFVKREPSGLAYTPGTRLLLTVMWSLPWPAIRLRTWTVDRLALVRKLPLAGSMVIDPKLMPLGNFAGSPKVGCLGSPGT